MPTRTAVALLVLPLLSGCFNYVPLRVSVMSASDSKPIAGAKVQVGYLVYMNALPPRAQDGATDDSGSVSLLFAANAPPAVVDASAPGYLPARHMVTAKHREASSQNHSPPELSIFLEKQLPGKEPRSNR